MSLLTSTALYPISLCLSTELASSPTLTYRHLSPPLSSTKPKRLNLKRVTDLYLGFSSPSLSSSGWADGAKVPGTRVWSVVTRKTCWDLCADSEEGRGGWVAALRELILAVTQKKVVEEGEGEERGEDRRPMPATAALGAAQLQPAAALPQRLLPLALLCPTSTVLPARLRCFRSALLPFLCLLLFSFCAWRRCGCVGCADLWAVLQPLRDGGRPHL